MKTSLLRSLWLALVAGLLTVSTLMAAPRTVKAGRISAPTYSGPKIAKSAAGQPSSNFAIQAYPLELPWLSAAESNGTEAQIMQDWRAGRLNMAPITTPSGYRLHQGAYSWWHYAVAVNGYSTWSGTNAPSGAFAGKPGLVAGVLMVVTALDDGLVDINMMSSLCSSPQDGQIDEARSFTTLGYGPTAIGIDANGSPVISGSGGVKQFAVIVYPELYGAANNAELDGIKSWVLVENANVFAINIDLRGVAGITLTTRAILSTRALGSLPPLTVARATGSVTVNVPTGVAGHAYLIEGTSDLNSGVWHPLAYIGSGAPVHLMVDQAAGFLRLME